MRPPLRCRRRRQGGGLTSAFDPHSRHAGTEELAGEGVESAEGRRRELLQGRLAPPGGQEGHVGLEMLMKNDCERAGLNRSGDHLWPPGLSLCVCVRPGCVRAPGHPLCPHRQAGGAAAAPAGSGLGPARHQPLPCRTAGRHHVASAMLPGPVGWFEAPLRCSSR